MRLPFSIIAAVLLVASCAGAASALAWEAVTVDAAGCVGSFSSLALDGAGNPRVSYYDETNQDLKYAWRDGAGWHCEVVDRDGNAGMWTSLALDAAGTPRISYFDDTTTGDGDLKYAWRDGAGWHCETVDAAGWVGEFTSLALDAAGDPRISYYDRTREDLKYAWRTETGWRIETVDSLRIVGWYSSLALDAAGNPRISYLYENADDLRYAWRNETGWQVETVDTEGYVGKCSSLVLDAAGNPRISYFDDTFENKDDLKYAWRDDAGWHCELVDTEGLVGWDTSLALDAAGTPRISYYDDTNDDLKYAWRDDAGWHCETVDRDGKVGMWTSLALDAAGDPWISYYDRTNGDLKCAGIASPPPYEDAVPGGTAPPLDADGDGLYEDVNGNGRRDFSDILIYFNQMAWLAAHGPVERFDYNHNGLVDFADVVLLFNALGTPAATPITAAFTMDRANGTAPLAVNFTSTSTGPFDDLAWTVMSGQSSFATMNGTAPAFTFRAPGAYAVALTARNTSTNQSATVTRPVTVTAPSGPNLPFPGPHVLPGRVEAEDYDVSVSSPAYADTTTINEGGAYRFDAVDIEVLGGKLDIGWIRMGEYLNYSVDVPAAGAFTLTLNVANVELKKRPVRIYLDGDPAGEVWIGSSPNWWTFTEFAAAAPITIPEGRHVLTVSFEEVERMNLDWLNLAAIAPTPPAGSGAPYPAGHVLPCRVEAEHFDAGGEGVAYRDREPANLGSDQACRPGEGVDLETAGGVTNVAFIRAGEALNYSVDMPAAGNVILSLRAANPDPAAKAVTIYLDGVLAGQVPVGPTGGWTAYREFAATTPLEVPAGRHVLTLAFEGVERINLDRLGFAAEAPAPTVTVTPETTVTETLTPNGTPEETPLPLPTVTATPEVTPETTPTVTVTPEVTPETTPTVTTTPEVTPETTPTVTTTPEVTPESTPTVTTTPEVTPESTPTVTATPEVTPESTPTAGIGAPYPAEHVLPCRVEAEHFDAGGEGVAYRDREPANLGSDQACRPGEGVDLETESGVTNVCFIRDGEVLNYSVDMPAAGNVTLSLYAANPHAAARAVTVYLDGVPAGEVPVGPTGGWTAYREFAATAPLEVPAGRHVLTLAFEGVEQLNLDRLDFGPEPPVPTVTVTPEATVTVVPGLEYTLTVSSLDLVNERVPVLNTGMVGVNLQGCTLSNQGSTRVYTFPAFVLGPGETVTLHTGSGADTGTDLY